MTGAGFWFMGGYARYVWPCFGLAAAVVAWNLWSALRYQAAAIRRARRALAMADSNKMAAVGELGAAARP